MGLATRETDETPDPVGAQAWRGILLAGVAALVGIAAHAIVPSLSPHVVAVVLGVVAANVGAVTGRLRIGLGVNGRRVLRMGIVLVGFRLSLTQVRDLGPGALGAVVVVVAVTFFGVLRLGRRLRISPSLSLLVATGCSICGASAIAAAEPLAEATEEEVAYAIALVTLCGSLAIAVLPALGTVFGMSSHEFGSWVGASVHDVGQVVAAASTRDSAALEAAVIVKLTRVALLAPLLTGVAVHARRSHAAPSGAAGVGPVARRPPLVPLFVVLFLIAVLIRSAAVIPRSGLDTVQQLETLLLAAGLFGLGAGVDIGRFRRLGGRPLALGLISWLLIAATSLGAALVIGRH